VGENGSDKSTLLEAVAAHHEPLVKALPIAFTTRTRTGSYLQAESFFNVATSVDEVGTVEACGGKSLHEQSHGEPFFVLLQQCIYMLRILMCTMSRKRLCPLRASSAFWCSSSMIC
jgi:predicted ATPase